MQHYLVCYDIADEKRLIRVHKRIIRHALFVQYSVYYYRGTQAGLSDLLLQMEDVIDPREDDVRAYNVQPLVDAMLLGQAWLPDDVVMV